MRPDTGHVVDVRIGDGRGIQADDHLFGAQAAECLYDERTQFGAMLRTPGVARKALVLRQLRLQQDLVAERQPLALVLQAEHHRAAVAGGERAVGVDGGVGGAGTRRRRRALVGVIQRVAHPLHQAFEHGNVDAAALARLVAQHQRREHAGVGVHARGDVGDGAAGLGHLGLARPAGDGEEAALALDQQVVGLFLFIGAALAVAGDVADDQSRKALMQRLEGQAHARGGARRQVLHQHVGLGQELVEDLGSGVLFHVQAQAFLRAVGPDEMRGQPIDPLVVAAGEVAGTGPLDLDHPCAEVGQLARAERRGDGVLEADHSDAIERAGFSGCIVHIRFLQIRRRVENGNAFSTRLFKSLQPWCCSGG